MDFMTIQQGQVLALLPLKTDGTAIAVGVQKHCFELTVVRLCRPGTRLSERARGKASVCIVTLVGRRYCIGVANPFVQAESTGYLEAVDARLQQETILVRQVAAASPYDAGEIFRVTNASRL